MKQRKSAKLRESADSGKPEPVPRHPRNLHQIFLVQCAADSLDNRTAIPRQSSSLSQSEITKEHQ